MSVPDIIDRRQREAAVLLLTAVDLPVEVRTWANLIMEAAKVLPGASMSHAAKDRRDGLERARDLINDMLAELA